MIKVTFSKAVKMRIDFSAEDSAFTEFEESLLSMENLDRSSPELWPEKSKSEHIKLLRKIEFLFKQFQV